MAGPSPTSSSYHESAQDPDDDPNVPLLGHPSNSRSNSPAAQVFEVAGVSPSRAAGKRGHVRGEASADASGPIVPTHGSSSRHRTSAPSGSSSSRPGRRSQNSNASQGNTTTSSTSPIASGAGFTSFPRNGRERVLLATCVALGLGFIASLTVLFFADTSGFHGRKDEICDSPACIKYSNMLFNAMDESADPCDDYYQHACGNWGQERIMPEDRSRIGSFSDLFVSNQNILINMLENTKPVHGGSGKMSKDDLKLFEKAKKFYNACNNVSAIEEIGVFPLRFAYQSAASSLIIARRENDLTEVFVQLDLIGGSPLVGIEVSSDMDDSSKQIIYVSFGGLTLPTKEYYKDNNYKDAAIKAISALLKITNNAFSFPSNGNTTEIAVSIIEFESRLAEFWPASQDLANPKKIFNKMSLNEGSKYFSFLNLTNLILRSFAARGIVLNLSDMDNVVLMWPHYFKDLGKIVDAKNMSEAFISYMQYSFFIAAMPYADEATRSSFSEFNRVVHGVKKEPPRNEVCLRKTENALGFALGRLFVNHKFSEQSRSVANTMIKNIVSTFRRVLENVEWFDSKVLEMAKLKLDKLIIKVGYPDIVDSPSLLLDYYSEVDVEKKNFYGMVLSATLANAKRNFRKISKPTDRTEWSMFPQTVNAYYNPSNNEIVFPAGILQLPFFGADLPDYINYGAIGSVIGHELSHGFDNTGRNFDAYGKMVDWWTPETSIVYEKLSKCFVDQYSNITVVGPGGSTINVNGNLTLGENIADNSGIMLAYRALKSSVENLKSLARLSGHEEKPAEHLFYHSFAMVWCGQERPEYRLQMIRSDPHSPIEVRVKGTVHNSKEFLKSYGCSSKDAESSSKTCNLWDTKKQ